ncbi:helix-turn-helix transcriptional regulator [Georgenia sp. SYP-B2076]|uniref:ArsR/SmtB family transcription factor n=1 Tax=Georgenia sp. SYP-B2076 TaxID=2495881 RepID=UPI000F8E8779|nr:helix-turn-helix domain-containing protein [Georgenia sp. SYP-B2076]
MEDSRQARLDARAVKVLAHPLRSRLLSALRLDGPATATALARTLGTNTGATSYHLRKLAEVGLVEETGEGTRRERWWRAAHESHSWFASDFDDDPESRAAHSWLQGEYARHFQTRADAWRRDEARWPAPWRDAAGASDYALDLSPDDLVSLVGEIDEVIERYRTPASAAAGPARDTHRVFVFLHTFPEVAGDAS